jgi:hypothetical protein
MLRRVSDRLVQRGARVAAVLRGIALGPRQGATVAAIALHLTTFGAASDPMMVLSQTAQARDRPADTAPDAADQPDEAKEPAGAPGTRNLDLTAAQCEAMALGKPVKDLPPDARIEAVTFTEPPPITLRLPTQRREALAECSLRASGLTARFDRARNRITLLPYGTRSPELPNPTIKVTLKLGDDAQKPEP